MLYRQLSYGSGDGSISSSDESDLESMIEHGRREPGVLKNLGRDAERAGKMRWRHWMSVVGSRPDRIGGGSGDASPASGAVVAER